MRKLLQPAFEFLECENCLKEYNPREEHAITGQMAVVRTMCRDCNAQWPTQEEND